MFFKTIGSAVIIYGSFCSMGEDFGPRLVILLFQIQSDQQFNRQLLCSDLQDNNQTMIYSASERIPLDILYMMLCYFLNSKSIKYRFFAHPSTHNNQS